MATLIERLEMDDSTVMEVMDFVMKHEPCGYYCDETVRHVDHKYFNWLKGVLSDIRNCKKALEAADNLATIALHNLPAGSSNPEKLIEVIKLADEYREAVSEADF